MTSTFDLAWQIIQAAEGGDRITDDPRDPGGLTRWGISQRAHPDRDIRQMTEAQAREIFRSDYWLPCRCGEMPAPIAIALADAAFNQGVGTAIRLLQAVLRVRRDGVVGPDTMRAVHHAEPLDLLKRYLAKRAYAYSGGNEVFLLGWFSRLFALQQAILEAR